MSYGSTLVSPASVASRCRRFLEWRSQQWFGPWDSRASDFGFRKMGHVQAARADAQGFRDRRARCAEYPVDHRGNRSSEDARISRINSTEMLAPPANQIHGLCSRRADSRTVSEHNGDGDALHLVRWVQRRSTFGLRLWCTDGGFRYFRLS